MKSKNKREMTEEDNLRNEIRKDESMSKNSFVSTIQTAALNKSGVEAKKKGF